MNVLQKIGFQLVGKTKLTEMALNEIKGLDFGQNANKLDKALYRFLGLGQIVWEDPDPQVFIDKGYKMNDIVYSVISFISRKFATIQFEAYREGKDGEKEVIPNHWKSELVNNPNSYQGRNEFLEEMIGFKMCTGNTYLYAPSPENGANKGRPLELHVMPATLTEIKSGGAFQPVDGYVVNYGGGSDVPFTKEEVIHMRYPNLDYGEGAELYGMSPLYPGFRIVQKQNSNVEAMRKSFENLGAAGILFSKGNGNLTPEQAGSLVKSYENKIAGIKNKGRIVATGAKDLGYINFGLSPVDLALLDDQVSNLQSISRLFQLPSEVIGDKSSSTYNNVLEARKAAWTDAIMPLIDSFVDEINRFLSSHDPDVKIRANYEHIQELQQDRQSQVEWLSKAYWISTQRKQEIMNEEIDDSLPKYIIPSGMQTAEDLSLEDFDIPPAE